MQLNKHDEFLSITVDSKKWKCNCSNKLNSKEQFYPSSLEGKPIKNTNFQWQGIYTCSECGRIIDKNTLKVIGRKDEVARLSYGGDDSELICICGSWEPMGYFYPCNFLGMEVDPDENWQNTTCCHSCGLIIASNLKIVGKRNAEIDACFLDDRITL
jgi:hypothetical protein